MDSGITDSYDSSASLMNESSVSIYSPIVLGRSERGTSWYASVMIIVNAGLGASLLAFPQAYDLAGGIPISLTFQTILGVVAVGSLIILSYCADQNGTGTYQETVEACCGQWTNAICSVVIAVYTFGCSITYLIIIGDLWDKVFDYAITDESMRRMWYLDRKFIISVSSILIILPLCIPKRIDFLRFASTVGVLGVCYIGVLIVAEYFTDLPPPGPIKTRPTHLSDIFYVLPAICFGYQCHVSAVPVYACMRGRPNVRLFALTAGLAILLCYLSYVATGVFGYLSFGSHVSADVLVDYPARPEVVAGLALLAIKTYTTYPILHFCGRSAIQTTVLRYSPWARENWNHIEPRWRYVSTTAWFFVSLVFALFAPDIGLVIGLLGGIAGLFILVFPGKGWPVVRELRKADGRRIDSSHETTNGTPEDTLLCTPLTLRTEPKSLQTVDSLEIPSAGASAEEFLIPYTGLCFLNVLLRQSPGNLSAKSSAGIAMAMLYIILGGFLFGLTTAQSIMQFIKHFSRSAISDTLVHDPLAWFSRFLTAGHVK